MNKTPIIIKVFDSSGVFYAKGMIVLSVLSLGMFDLVPHMK